MKNLSLLLTAGVLMLAACSTSKQQNNASTSKADTLTTLDSVASEHLTGRIAIKPIIQSGDPLQLSFTVYNRSAKTQQFCKWHTPFEPPMSKYLDVKDPQGNEAEYRGIMAKRIMPPPVSSYIEVKAGDSLNVKVDISKQYLVDKPGKYTVRYNAEGMSGIVVQDSISFIYKK